MPSRLSQSGTFPCCSHLGQVALHLPVVLSAGERFLTGEDLGWMGAFLHKGQHQGETHTGAISVSPEPECLKPKCPSPQGRSWHFQGFSILAHMRMSTSDPSLLT